MEGCHKCLIHTGVASEFLSTFINLAFSKLKRGILSDVKDEKFGLFIGRHCEQKKFYAAYDNSDFQLESVDEYLLRNLFVPSW